MRSVPSVVMCVLSLLAAAPAMAQQPLVLPGAPPAIPQGETLFVLEATDSQRFFDDAEVKGVPLLAREAVTVITRHQGLVRVFVRGRYGWVPEAALSAELPELPEPAEAPALPPE